MDPATLQPGHRLLASLIRNHPETSIPIDLGVCAIAIPHSPGLDPGVVCNELDAFAEEARGSAKNPNDPASLLEAVRRILFEVHGFAGNSEDYYHPGNSLIDQVLRTRKGIPITLSVILMETARRVGIPLEGIGLPCHFVVGWRAEGRLRLFDPFHGGEEKTIEQCIEMVHLLSGGSVSLSRSEFAPTSPRNILLRMLMNLRGIFRNRGETKSLIAALEQLLLVGGEEASIHGELALHLAESGRLVEAHSHLESYTRLLREVCGDAPIPAWAHRIRAGFSAFN